MITDYFNYAWKNLRKRKLRAWLTILGIVISIATIFILISLSLGLRGAINEQFRQVGTDKFVIQPKGQLGAPGTGGAVQLTTKDVEAVEEVAGVNGAIFAVFGSIKIEFNNKVRYYLAMGLPVDNIKNLQVLYEAGGMKAEQGELLGEGSKKEVVIGSRYNSNLLFGRKIGLGNKLTINGEDFRVGGVMKSLGNPSDDQNIYMPYEDFKQLFNSSDRVDIIYVQIKPGQNLTKVAADTEKALRRERDVTEKTQDFTILTPEAALASFEIILNILTAFLSGIAAISLIVGGIGIANTMYTSVLERTKEIGTMKAVGARNSDILKVFLIESGFLGLIGGIIGVVLGVGVSRIIEYIIAVQLGVGILKASYSPYLFLLCVLFAFIIGIFSGFLPARQASKLNPVEALRYE